MFFLKAIAFKYADEKLKWLSRERSFSENSESNQQENSKKTAINNGTQPPMMKKPYSQAPDTASTAVRLDFLQTEEQKIIKGLQQLFLSGEMDEYSQENDRLAEIREEIYANLMRPIIKKTSIIKFFNYIQLRNNFN